MSGTTNLDLPWSVYKVRRYLVRAGVHASGYQPSARTALIRSGVHPVPHTEVQRHRVRLTAGGRYRAS